MSEIASCVASEDHLNLNFLVFFQKVATFLLLSFILVQFSNEQTLLAIVLITLSNTAEYYQEKKIYKLNKCNKQQQLAWFDPKLLKKSSFNLQI